MVKLNCPETINHPPERSCTYMIPYKQLSLADIFTDCQNKFDNDKYAFLELLEQTIDLDEIVPVSFISHFHSSTGRPRKHQLYPMLRALLLQLIFSVPTTSLLIIFSGIPGSYGISVALMLYRMLLNLPGLNRIFSRTYNRCSTALLT